MKQRLLVQTFVAFSLFPLLSAQNTNKNKEKNPSPAATPTVAPTEAAVSDSSTPALPTPATSLPSVAPTLSGPIKEALQAFNEGRHVKAIEIAKPLADKGNGDALFLMGIAFESGRGVESSREKAIEYYTKAIAENQKDAIYRLAQIYFSSKEKADLDKALRVLEDEAKKNPSTAGRVLGEAYAKGFITGKTDIDLAMQWWTSASEAGDAISTRTLAGIYDGMEQFKEKKDSKKALELFKKAITQGDKSAMIAVGSRLLNGDESVRDEKSGREVLAKALEEKIYDAYLAIGDFEENVKKNVKEALVQYEKGAEQKQVDCALRASAIYAEGREGVVKNEVKAIDFLEKAATTGNPVACYSYAAKLLEVPDPDIRKPEQKISANIKAYPYLLTAAKGGIAEAQNNIALFYLQGRMGIEDPAAAAGWFQLAAQSGNPTAMANLAALCEKGIGTAQNFSQAGKLYEAAARAGNSAAATAVARLLASGAGTTRNIPHAWAWANFAIQEGSQEAKSLLGEVATIATPKDIEEGKKFLDDLRADIAKARGTASPEPEKKDDKPSSEGDTPKKEGEQ